MVLISGKLIGLDLDLRFFSDRRVKGWLQNFPACRMQFNLFTRPDRGKGACLRMPFLARTSFICHNMQSPCVLFLLGHGL